MKYKILLTAAAICAAVTACDEEDLVQLDPNSTTPENFFTLESQIESGLYSAYAVQQGVNMGSRLYFFLNDLRGDELMGTQALIGSLPRFLRGESLSTDGEVTSYWTALYQMIHYVNTTLEGIANNEELDEGILLALEAEGRFLRGWAYNELATHYGGVPIYTERAQVVSDAKPRSTEAETFDFAQADLAFAAENLPASRDEGAQGRATSGAAYAILGRSHMQQNELSEAKTALEAVVASGEYRLVERYGALFEEENNFLPESIYEIVFSPIGDFDWNGTGAGTASKMVRAQEYGPAWHNVQPSLDLLSHFVTNECEGEGYTDPRYRETVIFRGDEVVSRSTGEVLGTYSPNANGTTVDLCGTSLYPGSYKYGVLYKEIPGGYRTTTTNLIIMRYADVLLLLAEIEARQGNDEAALAYVQQIRDRVGARPIEESPFADDVLRLVQYERTVELALEQVRFRDIKRWRDADILPAEYELDYYEPNDRVLPIPNSEIINNPNLTQADQNPGYN